MRTAAVSDRDAVLEAMWLMAMAANLSQGVAPAAMWQSPCGARQRNEKESGIGVTITVIQTLNYYPFGAQRVNSNFGGISEGRQYIGQFSDTASGLDYLNARYMDPSRGQFTSEEPIFLNIGDPGQVKQLSQRDQQTYLTDPQQLNSYSYGRDNGPERPVMVGGALRSVNPR